MSKRKEQLLDEIRQVLARSIKERYLGLMDTRGDAIGEVRDINAAQERISASRYGICIDCCGPIGYQRLKAYPSAKRSLICQQQREKTRAPSKYTDH